MAGWKPTPLKQPSCLDDAACVVKHFLEVMIAMTSTFRFVAWALLLPTMAMAKEPLSPFAERALQPKVTEIPEAVIKKFKLDTEFYKKHVDYKGFSILGSAQGLRRGLARGPLPHRQAAGRARGHSQGDDQVGLPIHGDGPHRDDDRRARTAAHEERPQDQLGHAEPAAWGASCPPAARRICSTSRAIAIGKRTFSSTNSTTPSISKGFEESIRPSTRG